jgi:hypothetical protein
MIGLNRQNNLAEMPLGVEVMQGVRQFRECEGVIDDRDQLEMVDRAHHRFGAVAASRNDAVDVNFFRHQRHNGNRCRKPAQDAHLRDAPAAGHGRHRLLDRSRSDDVENEKARYLREGVFLIACLPDRAIRVALPVQPCFSSTFLTFLTSDISE